MDTQEHTETAHLENAEQGARGGTASDLYVYKALTCQLPKNSEEENSENQPPERTERYHSLPLVVVNLPDGSSRPAPFLMNRDEVAAFFRLHDSKTKFPDKTIQRYRRMGLKTVRVGRRVWFRLDDVLRFLDQQQEQLNEV